MSVERDIITYELYNRLENLSKEDWVELFELLEKLKTTK